MIQKITIIFRFKSIRFGFELFSLFYVLFVFEHIFIQVLFKISIKDVLSTLVVFLLIF